MNFFPPGTASWGTAEWENVPPGECCRPHRNMIPPLYTIEQETVVWGRLQAQQLALGWGGTELGPQVPECAGSPVARIMGPNPFAGTQRPDFSEIIHRMTNEPDYRPPRQPWPREFVFAASWIDLRTRFGPPSGANARYLQWQGVKSLVWGQNTWTAASDGIPFPKRDHVPKLNGFAPQGKATIQTPTRWRYPSSYTINGTIYADPGNGIYKSSDGKILNTTKPFRLIPYVDERKSIRSPMRNLRS
ncbi:MAG: hypothetical protein Q9218_002625 [Villophora microphyllina]